MEQNLEGEEFEKAVNEALFSSEKTGRYRIPMNRVPHSRSLRSQPLLEEGVVNEASSFYCGGSMEVKGRTSPLNCWKSIGTAARRLRRLHSILQRGLCQHRLKARRGTVL